MNKQLSMSFRLVSTLAASLAVCAVASSASAQTVLTGFNTGGDDMDGMEVIVDFLDGSSQTAIWATTGVDTGGAFGTDWSLSFSDWTTFDNPWTFSSSNLVESLTINAVPGNTVWDTDWPSSSGTPNSATGWTFETYSGLAPDSFDYSVPIDISVGDLWGTLSMTWNDGFSGTMQFLADTDNGTDTNPVTVAPSSVPEPGTMVGILIAGGLGLLAKRKSLE